MRSDTLCLQQLGDPANDQRADGPLPAGHGDRRVVEELEGDVGAAATAARIARLPE